VPPPLPVECSRVQRRVQPHVPTVSVGLGGSEKPRHDAREAGLVVISDLCPVTLGLSARLSTSLQSYVLCGLANR
jgi:hypothetical protein